jgi:hypothetical protein
MSSPNSQKQQVAAAEYTSKSKVSRHRVNLLNKNKNNKNKD